MTLSVVLCIDGNCEPIGILSDAVVPIPVCNSDGALNLPGDGTISGYLQLVSGVADDEAVDLIFDALGIKVLFIKAHIFNVINSSGVFKIDIIQII